MFIVDFVVMRRLNCIFGKDGARDRSPKEYINFFMQLGYFDFLYLESETKIRPQMTRQ